jgi:hypothetical protein
MKGMNFMNSSPISEKISAMVENIFTELSSIVPGLVIPNCSKIIPIAIEYIRYPIKRATARAISSLWSLKNCMIIPV